MTYEEAIKKFRLRLRETPEALEMRYSCGDGATIEYGDKVLVAGYYFDGIGRPPYFGAIYEALVDGEPVDAETDLELLDISAEFFWDRGHAIEWGIKNAIEWNKRNA